LASAKTATLAKDKAMSKIPRGLRVLIVMAILAVLVWRFATGTYFYPGLGAAILITILVIFFVYRTPRDRSSKETSRKSKANSKEEVDSSSIDDTSESPEMLEESGQVDDEILPVQREKRILDSKSQKPKPKATEVTARYMNMAKTAEKSNVSGDWHASPAVSKQPGDVGETSASKNVAADISDNGGPPLPLIEDETSLTSDEQNVLVNSVWCRCENPFCKYTRFLNVHHIVEEKSGGTNKLDNLIVLCPYCHDLAHRQEIPEKEMRDWISNREDRFKFKPDWKHK
jgi:hypothetical protein